MAILFGGIDIPVYEIFFISAILFFTGLVIMILGIFYILKELKTLKDLINTEEKDLAKFEKYIKMLEEYEKKPSKKNSNENDKKSDTSMVKYIKDNLAKGYTWEQLKLHLIAQGWDKKKLEEIYKQVK